MNLKESIKSKFDNYSPEVPEEVWGDISKKLGKEKAVVLLSRRFMAVASILLLLLAGGSYFILNNNTSTQVIVSTSNDNKHDKVLPNKIKEAISINKKDNKKPITLANNLSSNTPICKKTSLDDKISTSTTFNSNKVPPAVATASLEELQKDSAPIFKRILQISPKMETDPPLEYKLAESKDIALKSHLVTYAQLHGRDKKINPTDLSLRLGIGTGALSSKPEGKASVGIDLMQPQNSYSDSYDGAVEVVIKRGRFSFSGGLSYIQHSQNSLIASTNTIDEGASRAIVRAQKNGSNEIVLNTLAGRVKAPLDNTSASIMLSSKNESNSFMVSYNEELNINQDYGYLEMPLEASYDILSKNKFKIAFVGGGAVGVLANNRAKAVGGGDSYNLGKTEGLSNISLRANLGISTVFELNRRMSLGIQPYYSRYLNSINESSEIYTPSMLGIRTILNFDL
ncbi:MAG: hypothetical protein ACK5L5_00990 [Bacteroidales bacterium]